MNDIKSYMIDNIINNVDNNNVDIIKLISSNSLLLNDDMNNYNIIMDRILKSNKNKLLLRFINKFVNNCTKVIYKLYQYKHYNLALKLYKSNICSIDLDTKRK